jgi:hypothetical protein
MAMEAAARKQELIRINFTIETDESDLSAQRVGRVILFGKTVAMKRGYSSYG